MSTQKKNKTYKKIVEKTKFWPIVQLFENRNKFMEDVSKKTEGKIQKKIKEKDLYEEILNTVYKEKLRISNISWNADPKDDKEFWNSIKEKILKFEKDRNNKKISMEILPEIIRRYTK